MAMNSVGLGALAVACVVAAGGGGYLAVRHNVAAPPPSVAAAQDRNLEPQSAPDAVTETEGVITATPASGTAAQGVRSPSTSRSAAARSSETSQVATRQPRAGTTGSGRQAPVAAPNPEATPATSANTRPRGLEKPWPSSAANDTTSEPIAPAAEPEPAAAPVIEVAAVEPEPPQKLFEDLVVSSDSVIGLQIETTVTSEQAKIEDRVQAKVTRDVNVDDRVAIPAGTRAEGSITLVDRGGKFKERARLGVRFHTLVLADGTRLTLNTETVFRDGVAPSAQSTAKVGGAAVGGAILGAILGGSKGAILGGSAGAAGGAAAVMAGDRNAATLPAGSTLTVRLTAPVTVTVEH